MAARAGSVYVEIDGRAVKFDRAMRRARRQTRQFERQAQKSTKSASRAFGGLGSSIMGAMGAMAGFMTIAGALATIHGAISTYNTFATAMNNVKAVSGATAMQFSLLNEQAQLLGATTRFTAGQVAEAMSFMSMAGLQVNQVYQGVEHTLNLAAAANLDLGQSADIVTNIMTSMQLEVKDLGRATDILVKTFTSSNTKLGDLGYAFKFVAPIASASGVSIEEVSAALGLLGNAGMQGTLAGTALRVALIRLQNPTKQASKLMEKYSIEALDAKGRLKPLVDIIKEFEPHLQNAKLLGEVFGVRGYAGMVNLIAAGSEELANFTSELKKADGISKKIAETQMEGLPGALKELQSAAEGAAVALGESELGKAFEQLVDKSTEAFRAVTNLIKSEKSLGEQGLETLRYQRKSLEAEYVALGDKIEDLQKRAADKGRLKVVAAIEDLMIPGTIKHLEDQRTELAKNVAQLYEYERAQVRVREIAGRQIPGKKKKKPMVDDTPPVPTFPGMEGADPGAKALKSLQTLQAQYLRVTEQHRKALELESGRELAKFKVMLDKKLISQEQYETAKQQLAVVTAKRLEELQSREMKLFNSVASSISGALGSAMRNFVEEGKLDFRELTKSILSDIAVISLRMAVLGPLFGKAGGGQGQGLIGGLLSGMLGGGASNDNQASAAGGAAGLGSLAASVHHAGGKVGQSSGVTRTMPMAAFIGAPRLHNGGKILKGNEFPSILERGEVVVNPDKQSPKQRAPERPINVTMNISTPDVESFRKSRSQIGAELMRIVESGRRGA